MESWQTGSMVLANSSYYSGSSTRSSASAPPIAANEMKHGGRLSRNGHGREPLHVAALDGFELHGDAYQGDNAAGAALLGERHVSREFAAEPAQAARRTALRRRFQKQCFQTFA